MAFNRENLHAIGGTTGNAPTVFSYTTPDTADVLNNAGYFNAAADVLKLGDLIYAITSTGSTIVAALYYVRAHTASSVDVTDGTVLAATNTSEP